MKLNYLSFVIAIAATVSSVGCGSNTTPAPGVPGVVGAPSVPVVPGMPGTTGTGTLPVGCYYNGSSNCAPCPYGFSQSGSYCVSSTGAGYYGCSNGAFWNGYNCQTIYGAGYTGTCPAGTYWSNYFYACITQPNAYPPSGYNCQYRSYGGGLVWTYVCY
jgi:hypothetical protein